MRVRAVTRGFYLWMRHPGEVFEVPDHLVSLYHPGRPEAGWHEKVEDSAPVESPPIPAAKAGSPKPRRPKPKKAK